MIKDNKEIEKYRIEHPYDVYATGNNGAFIIPFRTVKLTVIASDGFGWDHVSVSLPNRCPNWPEMCFIKDLFFKEDETVIQFHPKKSSYKNIHP